MNLHSSFEVNPLFLKFKTFIRYSNFIFLITITNLYPQSNELYFTHLSAEDGLSLNAVTQIIQDSYGYLWFGTYQGLNRYNGYNFKHFLPEPSNPYSISNHSVWCMLEDTRGSIWIGTLDGLNRFDRKTERFYSYKHNPNDTNSIANNYIRTIFEDKSGTLWIGTQNGLSKYNREKNNFTSTKLVYNKLNTNSLNSVLCIEEDYKGNLWLGTWNGLTCIQKNGKWIYISLPDQKNLNALPYNTLSAIKEDDKKNLWIGTNGYGLYKYDQISGKFTIFKTVPEDPATISGNYISVIFEDRLNNLWVGTKNGLNKYNYKTNKVIRILHDPDKSSSICNNEILSILEDKTGILWIGTLGGGISKFSLSSSSFFYFKDDPKHKNMLENNHINSIFSNKQDNIFISTKKGLVELGFDKDKGGKLFPARYFSLNPGSNNTLSDNYVRCAIKDHLGLVWIGTDVGGLNCYDPVTKRYKVYRYDDTDSNSISNNGILNICEDHNGNIWIGTWYGLNVFNRRKENFTRILDISKNNTIWTIYEDSRHYIWCGTDGSGLKRYDPKTKYFTYFINNTISAKIPVSNRVFTAFESNDGVMWFGTADGLNSFDYKTQKFIIYTRENGLPSNVINDIKEDDYGFLWISTDKGLSKFDRNTGKFKNYTKRNGLKELEFSPTASGKLSDGKLLFGSSNGLLYFDPKITDKEYLDVPIVFTDLKIFNQSVPIAKDGILKESIQSSKRITIPPGNNVITLEFALLDYFDPKRNTFRYKLAGFDPKWNDVGTRNTATYTNLPPGTYNFFVKASNENGVNNVKEASIIIIIEPVYYQTWWFKIFVALSMLVIIIAIYQARTRAIKSRNKILEIKVSERTIDLDKTINELNQEIATKDKFFSIIAHDLRSPFTGLIGLLKYLVEDSESITNQELKSISETMLKSAEITYELLENLLQWARIRTGKINYEPEIINLTKILDDLIELYKDNASSKNISLNKYANGNIFAFADENMIKTILRNLLSNAIKFTKRYGQININLSDEDKFVRVKVCDSGIGISQDKLQQIFQADKSVSTLGTENEKGSGLGLVLCKEFIELNKGTLSVKTKLGEGSEFSFTLSKNQ